MIMTERHTSLLSVKLFPQALYPFSLQLCNHPMLSYPAVPGAPLDAAVIAAECGKLAVLDRLLVKLRAAGHRVLLFSTMTRLLDLLQVNILLTKTVSRREGACCRCWVGCGEAAGPRDNTYY